jgi:hypothetical protein
VGKENEELKRRVQLMELKYASRENMFRSLNDKVLFSSSIDLGSIGDV